MGNERNPIVSLIDLTCIWQKSRWLSRFVCHLEKPSIPTKIHHKSTLSSFFHKMILMYLSFIVNKRRDIRLKTNTDWSNSNNQSFLNYGQGRLGHTMSESAELIISLNVLMFEYCFPFESDWSSCLKMLPLCLLDNQLNKVLVFDDRWTCIYLLELLHCHHRLMAWLWDISSAICPQTAQGVRSLEIIPTFQTSAIIVKYKYKYKSIQINTNTNKI